MTPNEFDALVDQGYNRIPVVCEVLADLDTPLSVYLKLVEGPFGFLFESVHGGEKWGRYSIIGLPCRTRLKVYGNAVTVEVEGQVVEQTGHRPDTGAGIRPPADDFEAHVQVPGHLVMVALYGRPAKPGLFQLAIEQ